MKKYVMLCLMLCLLLTLLCGCGYRLSDQFSEDDLNAAGAEIVALVTAKDYEAVIDRFRPDLQEGLTAEDLDSAVSPILDKAGYFEKIKSTAVAEIEEDAEGGPFAMLVLMVNFSEDQLNFTLSFDTDGYLVGLYVK